MPKSKRPKKAKPAIAEMSTGEATVATLIAHGLDTVYALPGVHNDHLFDAFQRAGDSLRVIHTRHEQGAAYMALGAALATGKPQAYAVVPGPGLLNSGAALLTAYGMNAPVLALIGQIPAGRDRPRPRPSARDPRSGRHHRPAGRSLRPHRRTGGSVRESRQGDRRHAARPARPGRARMRHRRVGQARTGCSHRAANAGAAADASTTDAVRAAAKLLGKAKRVLIVAGGGAQDASPEVTLLSNMLQAPVLAYRRGRGVLDGRDPFSVTLPLGHELWGEADAVLAVGTRLLEPLTRWGIDNDLADRARRCRSGGAGALSQAEGGADRRCRADPAATDRRAREHNSRRASRRDEMQERQAKLRERLGKLAPQLAFLDVIRAELPEDGIYVDEVTQIGFAARLAFPVYKPRTFLSPGYQDNLGWGYATALGAQHARRDVPVLSINGDGGFLYTGNELATAMRHRIPLVAVVFADGAFGNVRRIQEEQFGNRLIACDLANPDFVKYAESFGAAGRRARSPAELGVALKAAIAAREPTLIEVPVGPMPSPWEFIHMPRVRGK